PSDRPGALEIGFTIPRQYNASRILFDNLSRGRGDRLALTGWAGTRSYAELCAEASRWGHGLQSLGLKRGDRVLMFLDDKPAYPAAFFGAVRAGLVPLLINTLTPPDLLQFYLSDSGAAVAVADAGFSACFSEIACAETSLRTRIIVNGSPRDPAVERCLFADTLYRADQGGRRRRDRLLLAAAIDVRGGSVVGRRVQRLEDADRNRNRRRPGFDRSVAHLSVQSPAGEKARFGRSARSRL